MTYHSKSKEKIAKISAEIVLFARYILAEQNIMEQGGFQNVYSSVNQLLGLPIALMTIFRNEVIKKLKRLFVFDYSFL